MGAGRKTSTYDVDTKAEHELAKWKFENEQRLLGEKLGGVIFVCNNDTYQECVDGKIFGLPYLHWCYVENIHEGMPIFLFNYSTRQLHGIWESTTAGEWKLNPAGWTGNLDSTRTMYPCQVGVRVYSGCPPLAQHEFRPILKAAYFNSLDPQFRGKFSLEVTKAESISLCQAFDRKAAASGGKRPQPLAATPSAAAAGLQASRAPAAPPSKPPAAQASNVEASSSSAALSDADFPALEPGSSQENAWKKQPNLPKVDEDGFEIVYGKGKGPRGQASAASRLTPRPASTTQTTSQPARQPPPQVKISPSANGSGAARAPEAPSTPPPTAPKEPSTPPKGQAHSTSTTAPPTSSMPNQEAITIAGCIAKILSLYDKVYGHSGMVVAQNIDDVYYCDPGAIEVAGASASDTIPAIAAVHAAVSAIDVAAADAVHNCFSVMSSHIQRLQVDQAATVQALQACQADSAILQREIVRMRAELAQLGKATELPISGEAPDLKNLSSNRPRKAILMLGGHDGQQWTTMMHLFYPQLGTVHEFEHVPFTQGYGGSVLLDRNVYVIGGGDGANWNKTAYSFALDTKEWFQVADMKQERGSLGVAEVGGHIYAMGGGRGDQTSVNMDTVEVFTPDLNAWHAGPKMHEQRFTTSAAPVNGAIYITGGFDGGNYLRTAERLDPRQGAWQPVPNMPHKRGSHMSAALGDCLYVMGGWDSEAYLDHLEVYDTRAGRWRSAPPLITPRAYGSTVVLDSQIYVIGGLAGAKHATEVERYDPATDKWEEVCEQPISRAFMSAVVVDL